MKVVNVAIMMIASGTVDFECVLGENTSSALKKAAEAYGPGYLVAYSGTIWPKREFSGTHYWRVLDGEDLRNVML